MRIPPRVFVSVFGALIAICGLSARADAQNRYAYVDPWAGCDPTAVVDDPTLPFATLQNAINACAPGDVVVANPGIYELAAPLDMKPLVSVQGVGARRCIILPAPDMTTMDIFWPDLPSCGHESVPKRVLINVHDWLSGEFMDGFTFRGGDVQIYNESEVEATMTVSNCLFDLATTVNATKPSIGYLLVSIWYGQNNIPYQQKRPNILNNTFLFGYRTYTSSGEAVDETAEADAVGIVDVNDPLCNSNGDPDSTLRGVNLPSVQNNLLRTLPSQVLQKVMLGINDTDTEALAAGSSIPTNAFRGVATGGATPPPVLYSSIVGGSPTPKVDLGPSGTPLNDPSFVGEFLASKSPATLGGYLDFRIMPGSPMIDQGQEPVNVGGALKLTAKNLTVYERFAGVLPGPDADYDSFDYDMEYFGNVRIAGTHVDIGFDEFHSLIVAGTYSNDDASHYKTKGPLTAVTSGPSADRWIFVAPFFANSTAAIVANGANVLASTSACASIFPAGPHTAWLIPIGALNPPYTAANPLGYATQYITFSTPFSPTPWNGTISPLITTDINPISGAALQYCLFDINPLGGPLVVTDTDGPFDQHFELQASIRQSGQVYYTNAQCEYR